MSSLILGRRRAAGAADPAGARRCRRCARCGRKGPPEPPEEPIRISPRTTRHGRSMTAFPIATACSTPRTCRCRGIAEAVGTPSYVYSTAALAERYRDFAAALSGLAATICYALKANTQPGGDAHARASSAREPTSSRRASWPRARRRGAGAEDRLRRRRQDRGGDGGGLTAGILQFNVESVPELAASLSACRAMGRRRRGAPCASIPMSMPDARQDHDRARAENKFGIEHRRRAGEIADRAARLPGIELPALARAYRLAAHLDRAVPRRLRPAGGAGARPASRAGTRSSARSRRRPRRVLRRRRRARPRRPMRRPVRDAVAGARTRHHLRAGTLSGRRCRHPADARSST